MPTTLVAVSLSPGGHAPPPAFVCSSSECGLEAGCVHVTGELDIATTPRFRRTLREAQLRAGLVVLDLRELTFMDSTGVHAIVDASTDARRTGRRLVILRGPPNVDRAFALCGTSAELDTRDLDPVEPPIQVLLQCAAEHAAP